MKAAIYTRKSKESDKGDSIENQVNMCITQLQFFGIKEYEIFEDYGISGKDTNRPAFQDMMTKIRNREFTHLVCYKLDRVARSVADFSALFEEISSFDTAFVSVKEQFDTSTPMGRAMMYMLSVFAQFERETISERVSDNMIEMAKNGKFLAGIAPVGYKREKIENEQGTVYTQLVVDDEYKDIPPLLYKKLFEIGSKSGVRKWLREKGYRTKRGAFYSDNSVTTILDNLVYLEATTKSSEYLEGLGYRVYNKQLLDKGYAFLHYNKQNFNSTKKYKIEDQVVAVSTHPYIITLEEYKKARSIIKNNNKFINNGKQINASLLTGLIKCSKCGKNYIIAYGRTKKYYRCWTKQKYNSKYCDSISLDAEKLEKIVINNLKTLLSDKETLLKKLNESNKDNTTVKNNIQKKIDQTKLEMQNLSNAIAKTGASDLLIEQYKLKEEYLENLEVEKAKSVTENLNYLLRKESISNFVNLIDTLDTPQKRMLLQDVVKCIYYDYDKEKIVIELFNDDFISDSDASLTTNHMDMGSSPL